MLFRFQCIYQSPYQSYQSTGRGSLENQDGVWSAWGPTRRGSNCRFIYYVGAFLNLLDTAVFAFAFAFVLRQNPDSVCVRGPPPPFASLFLLPLCLSFASQLNTNNSKRRWLLSQNKNCHSTINNNFLFNKFGGKHWLLRILEILNTSFFIIIIMILFFALDFICNLCQCKVKKKKKQNKWITKFIHL